MYNLYCRFILQNLHKMGNSSRTVRHSWRYRMPRAWESTQMVDLHSKSYLVKPATSATLCWPRSSLADRQQLVDCHEHWRGWSPKHHHHCTIRFPLNTAHRHLTVSVCENLLVGQARIYTESEAAARALFLGISDCLNIWELVKLMTSSGETMLRKSRR